MGSVLMERTRSGILWILVSLGAINWGGRICGSRSRDGSDKRGRRGDGGNYSVRSDLIAFGGTLTLLDNLGLYDVTDVVDEIKSFGGN